MYAGSLGTNQDDTLTVPAGRYNTYIAGFAGNDTLTDVRNHDFRGFNALYGGSGNDTYVSSYNSCTFIGDTGGTDTLVLPYTYNSFLWRFYDDGDVDIIDNSHLYLEIDDHEIFIQEFSNPQCKIEYVQFADGKVAFDDVFNAIRYELDYESSYHEFKPYVAGLLYEAMTLRDTLAAQEASSSGGVIQPPAVQSPTVQPPVVQPPTAGSYPVDYYNDTQYMAAKTAQMGPQWSTTRVDDAIRAAGMSHRQHFERYGAFEKNSSGEYGIDPSANFDVSKYYLWK